MRWASIGLLVVTTMACSQTAPPAAPRAPQRQLSSATLFMPGERSARRVDFELVNGVAMSEGDIVLGTPTEMAVRYGSPWTTSKNVHAATTIKGRTHLWPGGVIPYEIDPSISSQIGANIATAIGWVNQTELRLRPRLPTDADFVRFVTQGEGCNAHMGRIGGMQRVQLEAACADAGGIAHEILHAAGFNHEQSRGDRDLYITIMWDDIAPEFRFAFEKRGEDGQDVGPYDYASVMHYGAHSFSQTGRPTIITRVPNAPIGNRARLSEGDKQAITALYGQGGGVVPTLPALPALPAGWVVPTLPSAWTPPSVPSAWTPPALPSAWTPPPFPSGWTPPAAPAWPSPF